MSACVYLVFSRRESIGDYVMQPHRGFALTGTAKSKRVIAYMRSYFGEKIGLFFTFLHFYNANLIGLGCIGLAFGLYQYLTNQADNMLLPVYAIVAAIWSFTFTEYWQRKNAAACYHWNMTDFEKIETDLESYIEHNGTSKAGLKYGFFEAQGGWVDLEDVAKRYAIERPELIPYLPRSFAEPPGHLPDACFSCCQPARARSCNRYLSHFLRSLVSVTVGTTMVALVIVVTISLLVFKVVVSNTNAVWGPVCAGVVQVWR